MPVVGVHNLPVQEDSARLLVMFLARVCTAGIPLRLSSRAIHVRSCLGRLVNIYPTSLLLFETTHIYLNLCVK